MPQDSPMPLKRVLYHHRTQGKAVEGVHIRGVSDALRAEGVAVDIISVPGADPYASPKAMSPTRSSKSWMGALTRLPEPLFELLLDLLNDCGDDHPGRLLGPLRDAALAHAALEARRTTGSTVLIP